jgi:hypothetical protein
LTQHERLLREAFESHEHMTPDPADVYARVQELSRTYRMRRRGAQIAGGAVLGAGLIAGGLVVPGLFGNQGNPGVSAGVPAAAPPSVPASSALASSAPASSAPAAKPSATPTYSEAERAAFFDAGYGLEQAEKLAQVWKMPDLSAVKGEAGKRLLAGQKLPVRPDTSGVQTALESRRVRAFFGAGYDVDDADTLARLWKKPTAYDAKVEGGKRLLAGRALPIKP